MEAFDNRDTYLVVKCRATDLATIRKAIHASGPDSADLPILYPLARSSWHIMDKIGRSSYENLYAHLRHVFNKVLR